MRRVMVGIGRIPDGRCALVNYDKEVHGNEGGCCSWRQTTEDPRSLYKSFDNESIFVAEEMRGWKNWKQFCNTGNI